MVLPTLDVGGRYIFVFAGLSPYREPDFHLFVSERSMDSLSLHCNNILELLISISDQGCIC